MVWKKEVRIPKRGLLSQFAYVQNRLRDMAREKWLLQQERKKIINKIPDARMRKQLRNKVRADGWG